MSMLDDVYVEQLFPAKTPKSLLLSFIILSFVLLVGALVVLLKLPFILLIYAFLAVCLIIYSKDALYVEYEYALVNNELTVAIIYNKKRRAVIYEADLLSLTGAEALPNEANFNRVKGEASFDLSPNYFAPDAGLHYFVLEISQAKKSIPSILQRRSHMQALNNQHKVIVAFDEKLTNKTLRFMKRVNPSLQI